MAPINTLDRRDGFASGIFRTTCGSVLSATDGIEERMPDRIGPDGISVYEWRSHMARTEAGTA